MRRSAPAHTCVVGHSCTGLLLIIAQPWPSSSSLRAKGDNWQKSFSVFLAKTAAESAASWDREIWRTMETIQSAVALCTLRLWGNGMCERFCPHALHLLMSYLCEAEQGSSLGGHELLNFGWRNISAAGRETGRMSASLTWLWHAGCTARRPHTQYLHVLLHACHLAL